MSFSRFLCDSPALQPDGSTQRRHLAQLLAEAGATAHGVATVTDVSAEARQRYGAWLAAGRHAGMTYAERYGDVRDNPALLLPGARSLVSVAFSYATRRSQCAGAPRFSRYALGQDYHTVLRRRLQCVADAMQEQYGGDWRVCTDTAPLRERYWAQQAGVGFIGINNQLIVPGHGSRCFLAEIITTLSLPADEPCALTCDGCMRCVAACPGNALCTAGEAVDARRCLSYLTIEHRGELPADANLGRRIYGCDVCQDVCPHNACATEVAALPEFEPSEELLRLHDADIAAMTPEDFSRIFRGSAVKRCKYVGLMRNFASLQKY